MAAAASAVAAAAGGVPDAPAGPRPPAVRAAATDGGAANTSADPITAEWVAKLRGAAAATLPPLPSADLFRRSYGLFTLHAGVGLASGQVLLEVGKEQLDEPFMLAAEFSALDEGVTAANVYRRLDVVYASPDRVYAFRLARGTAPPTLELYRPPLGERSVAPDSVPGRQAVAGISASTLQSFPARPTSDGRLLINVGPWVAAGFHLSVFAGSSTRFVGGAAHPRSVTLAVQVARPDGACGALTVTVVGLPRRRMTPRPLDDRIGYLATNFSWADDYTAAKPSVHEAYINKWDLAKHPVLTYYVDPSVPRAFWPAVAEGIRRWNPAFAAAGHQRPVLRAVVPSDADWPADYAADDARFNTISFVPGNGGAAFADIKTDPRTGEILNADIILIDDLLRHFVAAYRLWFGNGSEGRVASRAGVAGGAASSVDAPSVHAPGGRVAGSEEDYVYQQVAAFMTHEVGHTLGFPHNYRGSAGIPWSQVTNNTYVETHGLTTSVMDYLPEEPLPRAKNGTPQRYFATPVVGAYDVAAIRYGYTDWRSEAEARDFAESVAAAGLALGVDADVATDALAQQFDLSATPLEWHRHLVRTAVRRVRELARTAGERPSASAADQYIDMATLIGSGAKSVQAAAKLVGATVTHRRRTGGAAAVTPLDAATEAAAARWVLSQLHPETGLLSAATVAAMSPHVLAVPSAGCVGGAACLARAPPALAAGLAADRAGVLATLLSPPRLDRLGANAAAAAAAGDDPGRRLSVAGLLAAVSETFFGARWADLAPPPAVSGASLFRAEAQAGWVTALKELAAPATDGGKASAAVAAAAAGELSRVAAAVAAAVEDAPDSTHLRGLCLATAAFVVA